MTASVTRNASNQTGVDRWRITQRCELTSENSSDRFMLTDELGNEAAVADDLLEETQLV